MKEYQFPLSDADIKEIQARIKFLDMQQYAIKIIINSIYGAFGNKHFYFHNRHIAQSITLQGQDLIKFSIEALNHYFRNKWHLDTELHKILGIDKYKINRVNSDAVIYVDTDSNYVHIKPLLASIEDSSFTDEDGLQFCIAVIKHRIASYLDSAFERYSSFHGTKNQMEFKLENISSKGIWLGKKNYTLRVGFEKRLLSKPYMLSKGIEQAKPSFPVYARDKLAEIINVMFDKGYSLDIDKDILPRLREWRKAFDLYEVEDVCFNNNITTYDKYAIDETSEETPSGVTHFARAVFFHNHEIEASHNMLYPKIRQGNKVKFYHARHRTDPTRNVFAFAPGNYPTEFAYPMDHDQQFFMLIVAPVNRLLKAMGYQDIDESLNRKVKLHMPKAKKSGVPNELLPYYIIDSVKLTYTEMPAEFNTYVGKSSLDMPEDVAVRYSAFLSTYGRYTEIVPKCKLESYIKTKKKAMDRTEAKKILESHGQEEVAFYTELVDKLSAEGIRIKVNIDPVAHTPIFSKGKVKLPMTYDEVFDYDTVDDCMNFIIENVIPAKEEKEE